MQLPKYLEIAYVAHVIFLLDGVSLEYSELSENAKGNILIGIVLCI